MGRRLKLQFVHMHLQPRIPRADASLFSRIVLPRLFPCSIDPGHRDVGPVLEDGADGGLTVAPSGRGAVGKDGNGGRGRGRAAPEAPAEASSRMTWARD